VRDWRVPPEHADRLVIKDINLTVRAGEIVGIAGLMGAGRTELAMSIRPRLRQEDQRQAFLHGKEVDLSTIGKAIDQGIAYVTEDRAA
jgi:putative multiple sugar transport system ATP-binding protein